MPAETDLRHRVAAICGATALDAAGVVHPANLTQLRELLADFAATGTAVRPDIAPAGPVSADAVVIAADRLDAVRLDASTLLLHAGAGVTWQAAREEAAVARLAVAGLGPTLRSDTVGAAVANGEVAHRTVVGVDFLTSGGELISAGGRTLKDVVGYDLTGLALGSGTSLGLIMAVTLRLEPRGARTATLVGPGQWRGDAGITLTALREASPPPSW